jgi:capsular polysaccharide biosynthesis protein
MIRGKGIRKRLKKLFVYFIKAIDKHKFFHNTPNELSSIQEQLIKGKQVEQLIVYTGHLRLEKQPEIWNYRISERFLRLYKRNCPQAFVLKIYNGKVSGYSSNWIIFPDESLSVELSREFGAYGGLKLENGRLIREKLRFEKKIILAGNVAVITTCGFDNFHHWNYDCLPRLHLLKQAINIEEIDYFVIHHSRQSFQLQSLNLFGINNKKIIQLGENQVLQAENLYVPSLPSALGTVSPWVVNFLREFYLTGKAFKKFTAKKIYLSRKNVSSRRIINNTDFDLLLSKFGFVEIFPEAYTVQEMGKIIEGADIIISVHGSSLSNICFMKQGTVVIDILAPFHQDPYYWQISNICGGNYIGFFAEGKHPKDDIDLVQAAVDDDLLLDLNSLRSLLEKLDYE